MPELADQDPSHCPCHNRPYLQCPNYAPTIFGRSIFDPHVDLIKPRSVIHGGRRTVVRPISPAPERSYR